MPRLSAVLAAAPFLLAACAETTTGTPDLASRIAGRTLTDTGGSVVTFTQDGRFTGTAPNGTPFAGVWEIENGLYCREVTEPANTPRGARTCQNVTIIGDTYTFNDVGTDRQRVWTVQG